MVQSYRAVFLAAVTYCAALAAARADCQGHDLFPALIPFPHHHDLRMYGNEVMDFTILGIAFDVEDRLLELDAYGIN